MACWEYTLTGFGDFLEQRRLAFTEPIPPSRVCSMCGRLPSGTALLPCGHVLCSECQGEVLDRMECPFEGEAFTKGQLVRLRFELSDLEQLPVVCMIGGSKCDTFSGKLFELKDHMRQCRSIDVQCVKCHRSIASEVAVEHYRQCYTETVPRRMSTDVRVQMAIENVQRIKEDLQILRQQSLGGPHTKKVTLILAHPTDETKDIRLTSVMDGCKLTRKPRLNEWNWGRKTENTSWKDIELQGFVVKDALYVNVEFE